MILRSLLFVPGDRPERVTKALQSGTDAVIIDLEDSVAPAAKLFAREVACRCLAEARASKAHIFVRINSLSTPWASEDVAAIGALNPDCIVLPKAEGRQSVDLLDRMLSDCGAAGTVVLPIAAETPRALFRLGEYSDCPRLAGLTWGAEDLRSAIGSRNEQQDGGRFCGPMEVARSLTLFAACAADVPAIETVYPNYRDLGGLKRFAARASLDGFCGMLAIHPAQVPIIRDAFTPDAAAVRDAQEIVAAFADVPKAAVLSLNGRMIDTPHLKRAKALLARAEL